MAKIKEEEEIADIVPENEYQEELEKEVAYYVAKAEKPEYISKKRYTPNKYPTKFSSKREEEDYQMEEIRRMINGYDGLTGKGYSFLNYCKLRDPQKGKIAPEFRVRQEEFFRKVESLQANPGRGIVGFKRRRFGFSNLAGWDVLHDCATKPYYQCGMNSKSEVDGRRLFATIKFMHQNLPDWLRPSTSVSDRRDYMEFAYWWDTEKQKIVSQKGLHTVKKGNQSWILSNPPVPQSNEGNAFSKLLIDEAGKIGCLNELWGYSEDCLIINTRRVGVPILMGTVGSIDKDGKGLMEMYLNNEAYGLDRFPVYGYHGLIMDDCGNDRVIDAIRFIIYKRHKLKSASKKVQSTFLQKYPLCENDAFYQVNDGGVGNIHLINEQIVKIISNSPEKRIGWMRAKPDGGVDFVPNPNGKIIVYELPQILDNAYVAGSDNADHENVSGADVSDLALAIIAKPFGTDAPKLVLEYADRPDKLDGFFEQTAMALKWYNNTKVLIEDNRARMINYFKDHYPHLLPLVPKGIATARAGFEMKHSVKMTEERKQQMMGLIEDYVDKYSEFIPSIRLLEEFKVFGDDHAKDDLAIAFGWALVMLQADKKPASAKDLDTTPKGHSLQKINGVLRLVTSGTPIRRLTIPTNPLFRR